MLSNTQIKYINSLKILKYRNLHKSFIAETPKLIQEFLDSNFEIKAIFGTKEWISNTRLNSKHSIKLTEVNDRELKKISNLENPNQVIAIIKKPDYHINEDHLTNELILMLDEIKDPGNLGTIIRLADWFDIGTIICSNESVDVYNHKVIQSTMGSVTRVKVFYENLDAILSRFKGKVEIFGSGLEGNNLYEEKLPATGILIIGNESRGISDKIKPYINRTLVIPTYRKGAESLNASIATAIMVSEFKKNIAHHKTNQE